MTPARNIRILVVEDDREEAALIKRVLEKKVSAKVDLALDCAEARRKIPSGIYDAITTDYMLPDGNGLELLQEIVAAEEHPPVILITGQGDEAVATNAWRAGASGYVIKDKNLGPMLVESVERAISRTSVRRAEELLKERGAIYTTLYEESPTPMFIETIDGIIEDVNKAASEMLGYAPGELIGRPAIEIVNPKRRREFDEAVERLKEGQTVEFENVHRDGHLVPVEVSARKIDTRRGPRFVVSTWDITNRKRIEEALHGVIKETNERREEITSLLEATRLVLEQAKFSEAARAIFDLCRKLVGAGDGYVMLFGTEGAGNEAVFVERRGRGRTSGKELPFLREGLSADLFTSDRAIAENDFGSSELASGLRQGAHLPENIMLVPLFIEGAARGMICLADKPGGFTSRDALMGAAFGEIASLALRNSRTVEKLERSEQRFRSVAETANDGIICADTEGTVTFWNEGAEAIFGYSSEEAVGQPLTVIAPERFHGAHKEAIDRMMASGTLEGVERTLEVMGRRKDGSEFPLELSVATGTAGGTFFLVGIARDITERKQAEEALRQGEERYRNLVENAPVVIYTIGRDGTLSSLNPAFEKITGWSRDEILGKSFIEMVHPDDLPKAIETFQQASSGDAPPPYELRILSSTGEYDVVGEFVSTPLVEGGNVVGELGIARDVTDRRKAEELMKIQGDLAMKLASAASLEEVLEPVLDAGLRATGLDSGGIYIRDETGALDLAHYRGLPEEFAEGASSYEADSPQVRLVSEGKSVFDRIENFSLPKAGEKSAEDIKFLGMVPITFEGELLGAIKVASRTRDGLPEESKRVLEILASQAGQAIARAKLDAAVRESEELYRTLVETTSDGVIVLGLDGTIVSASIEAIRVPGGFEPGELEGTQILERVAPEDRERAAIELKEILEKGSMRNSEYTILRKDGSPQFVELNGTLLSDEDGNPSGIVITIHDISERRRAEEERRSTEDLYRTLLYMSPDAVTMSNLEGNIIDCSTRTLELHGFESVEEVKGRSAFELIAPEDHERALDNLERTLAEGVARNLEYTLLRKDGSRFIGELSAALLRGKDGNPSGFIASVRNITERKQMEIELQNLNIELEGYAHTVSHDLKGPLSRIYGASETLKRLLEKPPSEEMTEVTEEVMDIISSGVEEANELVEGLLSLAEVGAKPGEVSTVDVSVVVDRVLADHAAEIARQGFKVKVDPDMGRIRANETHIYQVFGNLIGNSIKHNTSSKPSVKVSYLGEESNVHHYQVRDNGPGIPEDIMDKIFLPFYSGETGDTGIGLATVSKIVQTYEGDITATNDRGARFDFTLKDAD